MPRSDPSEVAGRHLAAGRVAEAKAIYEDLLREQPTHARALCGLGTIALRSGEVEKAFELIGHAATVAPTDAMTLGNLGVVYLARKEAEAAEDCFRRALDLDPSLPELHANFASVLLARGNVDRALLAQRYAIALDPESALPHYNLGNMLSVLGRHDEAIAAYEDALALDPEHVGALNNLAVLHKQAGRLDDARALLDEARLRDPMNPELMANHADLLLRRGRGDEALDTMRRAVRLAPKHPLLKAAFGTMLLELGRLDEAAAELAAAMRAAPENAEIAFNLARLLRRRAQLDAAQVAAERAVSLANGPSPADALATELLLMRGKWEEAWSRLANGSNGPFAETDLGPGADLTGLPVRLVSLDAAASLFAARFVPVLAARGAVPEIVCPPVLAPLMATVAGVATTVAAEILDPADLAADGIPTLFLDSLPQRLRAVPDQPPPQLPLFAVPPAARPSSKEPRVGLWWEGAGPGAALPRAMAGVEGIRFVSLQTGAARAELPADSAADESGSIGDLRDLAAAIRTLDVMIAPDGPVAHLAASLGVETWVLTGRDGSWHWCTAGATSAWYPNSRAFSQSADGSWTGALAEVRAALSARSVGVEPAGERP